ncbi:MAG: radical SAM protein, partial [Candidatus Omnitrophota bacterium]
HCWLRIPPESKEKNKELSFAEIRGIVDDARKMGCRRWSISGGEPMLRPDFLEIFDYIIGNRGSYSLNTNGTLITPEIAKALKRKGVKMIALYGATADIHDHITRSPGSFEAVMRGFRYMKEAGAGFTVQLIPMRDNYHQFKDMVKLAESLGGRCRVGAAWLYLSAGGDRERNEEIMRQRLLPREVIEIDRPDMSHEASVNGGHGQRNEGMSDEYLFSSCVNNRRDFHVDPSGKMTFCCFIKDPSMRYDLRNGSFRDCWENFIPSLGAKVKITEEYRKKCGSCELRKDCRFCPVYGYLEHRDFNERVEYLCAVAAENRRFKENWRKNHRRYFKIADMTMQVESDLPFRDNTFHPKFRLFEADGPGKDMIYIRHYFSLPELDAADLGEERYRRPPWAVYRNNGSWIYLGISSEEGNKDLHRVVVSNHDHSRVNIYNNREDSFLKGNSPSLTMLSSDQMLLARVLADRQGCYLHSCGVNFNGNGLLFAGHSESGKSTMAAMLRGKAEILCDDRIIIRKSQKGFNIFGTWSHGDVPDISGNSAPLRAIMFLEKSDKNLIIPIKDKKEKIKKILPCLIRPFVTVDWWDKTLSLVGDMAMSVPCYELRFDKSGRIAETLKGIF